MLQELKTADPMLQPLKTLVDYLSPGTNKPAIVADIDAKVRKMFKKISCFELKSILLQLAN